MSSGKKTFRKALLPLRLSLNALMQPLTVRTAWRQLKS